MMGRACKLSMGMSSDAAGRACGNEGDHAGYATLPSFVGLVLTVGHFTIDLLMMIDISCSAYCSPDDEDLLWSNAAD